MSARLQLTYIYCRALSPWAGVGVNPECVELLQWTRPLHPQPVLPPRKADIPTQVTRYAAHCRDAPTTDLLPAL